MSNIQRFTQRAQRVLDLAQDECEGRKQTILNSEHLLLALYREDGGVAGRVLTRLC